MRRLTLALCLTVLCSGCFSFSTTKLDGSGLRYPVSFSQSIVGTDGATYTPRETEKLAHFSRSWGHWGWLYDSIPLSSDVQLSEVLHEEIKRANGNGIVNLKITAKGTGWSWLVSLLIIIPEHVKVTVEGDVIRAAAADL